MAKVYGIDLGTTYSAIATLDDNGLPYVIDDFTEGSELLASAVYFQAGGEPVVGKIAKEQAEIEPDRVVQFIKREIGKEDVQRRVFDGKEYDPIVISSLILKRMKDYAMAQGHDVKDVVITCPAYFGNEERAATEQAGIIAGLNVLNIVNEPTAAALHYCAREFQQDQRIMIFDLGGGTFDITLFDFGANEQGKFVITVLESNGNDQLGGKDWDEHMFELICENFADENGIERHDLDHDLEVKIRSQVEEIKRTLSHATSKNINLKHDGDVTRVEITREAFEAKTQHLVHQTVDLVKKVMGDAGVTADQVDRVLLVGGSTSMPMIKDAVDCMFPGKALYEQPNLAVAKGAALAAAVEYVEAVGQSEVKGSRSSNGKGDTTGAESDPQNQQVETVSAFAGLENFGSFNDILSRSFGPGVMVDEVTYMIDNLLFVGDPVRSEAEETYYSIYDNQPFIRIVAFENVATDRVNRTVTPSLGAEGNKQYTDPALKVKDLGKLDLPLPPNTPRGEAIRVYFRASTLGIEVRATNIRTGTSVDATLEYTTVKNEEELQEAISFVAGIRPTGDL